MRRALLFFFALALSASAQAALIVGFSGDYAPENWVTSPGTGSIGAFGTTGLSLTGGDDGSDLPSSTDVSIVIAQAQATIMFDWTYETSDLGESPLWDPFGVKTLLRGDLPPPLFTSLVDLLGASTQSGSFSIVLNFGDMFAFSQQTVDNLAGAATARITGFRVQTVAEPSTLAFLALPLLLAGVAVRRRYAT